MLKKGDMPKICLCNTLECMIKAGLLLLKCTEITITAQKEQVLHGLDVDIVTLLTYYCTCHVVCICVAVVTNICPLCDAFLLSGVINPFSTSLNPELHSIVKTKTLQSNETWDCIIIYLHMCTGKSQ